MRWCGRAQTSLADNVLWSGRVVDQIDTEADTEALRLFNDKVAADDRVEVVMLTAFDGLTIARKLEEPRCGDTSGTSFRSATRESAIPTNRAEGGRTTQLSAQ